MADGNDEYSYADKDAAYISYAKALVKNASAEELTTASEYSKFWKIDSDCAKLKAKYAELSKDVELKDSDYALVIGEGEAKQLKFASYDAKSTALATNSFYDQRQYLPYEYRQLVAQDLLVKSARYNVILPAYQDAYLHKAAGFGAIDEDCLESALLKREQQCTPDNIEVFNKVAELAETLRGAKELYSDFDFVKQALSALDGYNELTGYQGPTIEEELIPDMLTTLSLEKQASEYDSNIVKMVNGKELDIRKLEKSALAAIDPNLAGMDNKELKDVLSTLPLGDANTLCRLVA